MSRREITEKAQYLLGLAFDGLILLHDRYFDYVAALSFKVFPPGRPQVSPHYLALAIVVAGIVLAQVIANINNSRHAAVASAHEFSLGAFTERVPLANNPDDLVDRVEVYYAPTKIMSKEEALKILNITVNREDIIQFVPDPILGMGSKITIIRATPIMIDNGGSRSYLRTFKTTVKELLDEQGVKLNDKDRVDPSLNSNLWWGGRVIVTRVEEGVFLAIEDIRYDVETREDPHKYKDEVTVLREGKRGKKEVTAFIRRENGREVERRIIAEKVLAKPVTKVEVRGAKHRPTSGRWADLINEIAPRYWADPVGLTKIMMCESGGNLTSYNPAGPYYGMFQFDEYTWTRIAGYPMSMIHDARAQIDGAAKLYSARYWHWPVCSRGT